jgi:hypothetical protein
MHTILDTVLSAVIGGLILLSLHSLNRNFTNAASTKMVTTGVHENLSTVTDILEFDLRKTGYNNFNSGNFKIAESSRVAIRADFNNDGQPDSVMYYLGASTDHDRINARARVLYRSYNAGTPVAMQLGITRLRFWYYDHTGNPLATTPAVADPSRIATIRASVAMSVGSIIETKKIANGSVVKDTTFSSAAWERTIKPVNVK